MQMQTETSKENADNDSTLAYEYLRVTIVGSHHVGHIMRALIMCSQNLSLMHKFNTS